MFISGIGWSDKHRSSMYRQSWPSLGAGRALWSFRLSKLQTSFINVRQWIGGSWEGGVYLRIRIWILEAVVWGLLSLTRACFTEKKKKKRDKRPGGRALEKKKRERDGKLQFNIYTDIICINYMPVNICNVFSSSFSFVFVKFQWRL